MNVLVAGGGVAGLETALALRALGEGRIGVELLAPEPHFYYRPLAVSEPFGGQPVRRWELADLARSAGAGLIPGELAGLDTDEHVAFPRQGPPLGYDAIVLACGARPQVAVPGSLTFRGPADVDALRALLERAARGEVGRIAFAVPTGIVWPLPIYELALQAQERLGSAAEIALVTSEPSPLALFGGRAGEAVGAALAERGIDVRVSTYAESFGEDGLVVRGGTLPADAVVALPRLAAPELAGVPRVATGFVPTDPHGRVRGRPGRLRGRRPDLLPDQAGRPRRPAGGCGSRDDRRRGRRPPRPAAVPPGPARPPPHRRWPGVPARRARRRPRRDVGGLGRASVVAAREDRRPLPRRRSSPSSACSAVDPVEAEEVEEVERIELESASVHELG